MTIDCCFYVIFCMLFACYFRCILSFLRWTISTFIMTTVRLSIYYRCYLTAHRQKHFVGLQDSLSIKISHLFFRTSLLLRGWCIVVIMVRYIVCSLCCLLHHVTSARHIMCLTWPAARHIMCLPWHTVTYCPSYHVPQMTYCPSHHVPHVTSCPSYQLPHLICCLSYQVPQACSVAVACNMNW